MRLVYLVSALACVLLAPDVVAQQQDSQASTGPTSTRQSQSVPIVVSSYPALPSRRQLVLSGVDLAAWVMFSPAARSQLRQLVLQPGPALTSRRPALPVVAQQQDSQANTGPALTGHRP